MLRITSPTDACEHRRTCSRGLVALGATSQTGSGRTTHLLGGRLVMLRITSRNRSVFAAGAPTACGLVALGATSRVGSGRTTRLLGGGLVMLRITSRTEGRECRRAERASLRGCHPRLWVDTPEDGVATHKFGG